jgi:glucose-fructose oxidoreductase
MKRRNFIKNGALIATTPLMIPKAIAHIIVPKVKDQLGIALVGLGYYSTDVLAKSLLVTQKCKLTGIVTGSPEKAAQWQSKYNLSDKNIYNYSSFDQIANNPDIDVIYIVLPPSMHEEYVVRAAKAGKQVWCEKPMAPSVAACQAMIEACSKNKVNLSIGYRMHHEPNTKDIMEWAKSKPYGKIKALRAAAGYRENRTDHWKQKKAMGGGVMGDMGVYPLNAVRYATGMEPVAVTAKASTTRPEIYHEVEETMQFDLEFPGGLMAKCEASFGKSLGTLHIDCDKGWYELEPFQAYSGAKGTTSDGKILNKTLPNQQASQMDDDVMAIQLKKPGLAPGEEGLKDITVVEAIYKSAASGKRIKI